VTPKRVCLCGYSCICACAVVGVSPSGVKVSLRGPVKRGDGVVFDCSRPEEREEGGSVYEVIDGRGRSIGLPGEKAVDKGMVTLTFGKGAVDMRRIRIGDLVWRNR
jgi:putative protease